MVISRYTKPELEKIEALANFTEEEKALFWYRAKDTSIEKSAELMNVSVSTAKRISVRIKNKISRL